LIDQFFEACGIFEDWLGKHGILFFDMAAPYRGREFADS